MAINSGALRPEIEYALRRMGCLEMVSAIVSAEDTEKCKPDPEGYRLALAALRARRGTSATGLGIPDGLAASDCLVIEDSLAGIVSAKGAGMWAIGVATTYDADSLRRAGADAVIDALAVATPEWIERRFSLARNPARRDAGTAPVLNAAATSVFDFDF